MQAKAGRDYEGELAKINLDYDDGRQKLKTNLEQEKSKRLAEGVSAEEQLQAYVEAIKELNQRIADLEVQPSVMPLRNEEADELIRLRQEYEDLSVTLQRKLAEYKEWDEVFYRQQEEVIQKSMLIEELKRQLDELKGQLNTSKEQCVSVEAEKAGLAEGLRLAQEALNRSSAPALQLRPEEKQELENRIKELEAEIARLQSDLAAKPKVTSHAQGRGRRGNARGFSGRGRGALPQTPVTLNKKKAKE